MKYFITFFQIHPWVCFIVLTVSWIYDRNTTVIIDKKLSHNFTIRQTTSAPLNAPAIIYSQVEKSETSEISEISEIFSRDF